MKTLRYLKDKATNRDDYRIYFPHTVDTGKRASLDTLAFEGIKFGQTFRSQIANQNQTWIIVAKAENIENQLDGMVSYGSEPFAGTWELRAGNASTWDAELKINQTSPMAVNFTRISAGRVFPLWGRGGENHGSAVIYYENGIRKWLWKFFEFGYSDDHRDYWAMCNQDGSLRVDDDNNYISSEVEEYGKFEPNTKFIKILNTGDVARTQGGLTGDQLILTGDSDWNIYSIEFDREFYLLNAWRNGYQMVTSEFSKQVIGASGRIKIFADLSAGAMADGEFGEMVVYPYIGKSARNAIEYYLANKWNVDINPEIQKPDPAEVGKQYDEWAGRNRYPAVKGGQGIYLDDSGVITGSGFDGLYTATMDNILVPYSKSDTSHTRQQAAWLYKHSDGIGFFEETWAGSDYIYRHLNFVFRPLYYAKDGRAFHALPKIFSIGLTWGTVLENADIFDRMGIHIIDPTHELTLPITWLSGDAGSLFQIYNDDETITYNWVEENGELVFTADDNSHKRKTINGNICLLSQSYPIDGEPNGMETSGMRGFYDSSNDTIDYHTRGSNEFEFEMTGRRLVAEPSVPSNVATGIAVEPVSRVEAFRITDEPAKVKAELDYDYSFVQELNDGSFRAEMDGDALVMVTGAGNIYKRPDLLSDFTLSASVPANRGRCRISTNGRRIAIAPSNGLIEIYEYDKGNDSVTKIQELHPPPGAGANFNNDWGYNFAINNDGSQIAVGIWYSSGFRGSGEVRPDVYNHFGGMVIIYKEQANGVYTEVGSDPELLDSRAFNMYGGFGGHNGAMQYASTLLQFSPNGQYLIIGNSNIREEINTVPILKWNESKNIWEKNIEISRKLWMFGYFVNITNHHFMISSPMYNKHFVFNYGDGYFREGNTISAPQGVSMRVSLSEGVYGNATASVQGGTWITNPVRQWNGSYKDVWIGRHLGINSYLLSPHTRSVTRPLENNYRLIRHHYRKVDYGHFDGDIYLAGDGFKNGWHFQVIAHKGKLKIYRVNQTTF